MKRVLVIADDLTGAAEIGGIGVQHGMSATIIAGEFRDVDDADLLVIDTDTRNEKPEKAAQRIRTILHDCKRDAFDLIYKKTDSVLRGPVAAEIGAVCEALGFERALLAPQNPTLGRVVRNGTYFVNGVPLDRTQFAHDPEHPRRSADVRELLGDDSARITIASAESVEELREAARQIGPSVLPAGGADFFAAMLHRELFPSSGNPGEGQGGGFPFGAEPPPQPSPGVPEEGEKRTRFRGAFQFVGVHLFVCGSACDSSRSAVQTANVRGICIVPMPARLVHAAIPDSRMIKEWADAVGAAIDRCGKVIMAVTAPPLSQQANHVRQVMASAVARVLAHHRIDALWIEGGATAAAIVDAMEWREFRVEATLAAGVVALCARDEHDQRLIIKPGSYAWPAGAL